MTPAQPALFFALLIGTPALAQQDIETGPVQTLGGAGAAHAHDNGALSVNPAAIGLAERYGLSLVGGFWDGRDWRAGLVAVDNLTTDGVAMGVGYQHFVTQRALTLEELPGWTSENGDSGSTRIFDSVTVGLAAPLFEDRLSFGVSGQLQFVSHPILGRATSGDVEAGVAGRPTEEWAVGVAVRNILPRFFVTDQSIGLVAGTRYAWNDHTSVAVDVDVPFVGEAEGLPLSIGGGGEWGDDNRQIGIGYRYVGPSAEHWLNAGFGIYNDTAQDSEGGNMAGLHYALRVPLHPLKDQTNRLYALQHTLTLTIAPKRPER